MISPSADQISCLFLLSASLHFPGIDPRPPWWVWTWECHRSRRRRRRRTFGESMSCRRTGVRLGATSRWRFGNLEDGFGLQKRCLKWPGSCWSHKVFKHWRKGVYSMWPCDIWEVWTFSGDAESFQSRQDVFDPADARRNAGLAGFAPRRMWGCQISQETLSRTSSHRSYDLSTIPTAGHGDQKRLTTVYLQCTKDSKGSHGNPKNMCFLFSCVHLKALETGIRHVS